MFHKKVSDLGAFFFVLVNHDFWYLHSTQFNYVVPIIMILKVHYHMQYYIKRLRIEIVVEILYFGRQ
jgi:hypothetical protein